MFYPDMRALTSFAASASGANEPATLVVVLTGISLVFGILVILWLLLLLEGKIFQSLDEKKKQKELQQKASEKKPEPAPAPAAAPAPAPVVEEGIPPEVVAAITAAVASIEGGKYTLRAVQAQKQGRGQWGLAGVVSYTEPF